VRLYGGKKSGILLMFITPLMKLRLLGLSLEYCII